MAKKPRHGLRPQAKSPAPPSLRNGRKDRPATTRRKSRFEQLEDRRVLAVFSGGDIVVEQINATTNLTTPTSAASPVFLSEFSPTIANQSTYIAQVALPSAVSGSNQPLTISGTAASEGGLSLSANGADLVIGGYDTAAGGTTQGDSTVGLVDANGDVNTTTTTTLLSGNNTRGAASVDGTSVWVAGASGVVYETTGSSGGTLVDSKPNTRNIEVAPAAVSPTATNELFASTNKTNLGVQSFSPALPNSGGASDTVLSGMTSTNAPDTYGFFFANPTTMFVADANLGLQEWTLTSNTWSEVATLSGSYVGLTGVQTGNTVSLYATTGTSAAAGRVNGNELVSDTFTFNSGTTGTGTFNPTPTVLATAGADYGFAGVAFAPQAAAITPVVTMSSSTTAGSPQTVTVTATYASGPDVGQTDTSYTGTIAFTSSDSQAVLPSNYTFMAGNNGVATFTNGVTLKTAGNQTVTATDQSTGGYSAATVAVSPAALHQLGISAPVDATSGIAFSVTVSAQDQYGNTIPGYLGTVSFSGGGAGATLPSSYTFVSGDNGSHTFTNGVTLVAGSPTGAAETITASDSGNSITGSTSVEDYVVSPFTANDFLVYRVGTGSTNLSGDSVPVYLDEYNSLGALIETDPLPVASNAATGNQALTGAGNALSEGQISLSPNGEYLAVTGYDTGIGYPTVSASTSELVPRTVGIIGPSGSVNTTTALTDFSSEDNVRGAVTTNGTSIWVSGNSGGVAYTTVGASTSTAILGSSQEQNVGQVEIVDGQLYVSSKKVTDESLFGIGTGAPAATGQTLNPLSIGGGQFVGSQGEAADGYFLTQENPSSGGPDTLYLTDSAGVNGDFLGDIEKYSLSGGIWNFDGEFEAPGVTGITGVETGTGATAVVTLYATTSGSLGETGTVYAFTDNTGFGGYVSGSASTLVTAGTNEAFRGVAMVPQTPSSTATQFVISAPADAVAGTPFNFTVTAENASGTPVPYTGTVNFTSTDSNSDVVLPTQYTFTGGDSETFSATLITAGTQTITGGGGIFGTSNSITVTPTAPHGVSVTAPSDVTAGIAFSVTVAVEDQYGNPVTGFTGTVQFSGGGTGASLPANYTFTSADAGSHTFTGVTLSTAAGSGPGTNETITATDLTDSISNSATVDDYAVSAFTSGDIVVEQINAANNSVTPTSSASPVFLSEYNTTGSQSSAVLTVPIWSSAVSGSNNPLTIGGTAASEGALSLSANGEDLVVAGYDTAAGGTTQGNTTVGLVNGNGVVNTSTTTALLSGNNTRGAASVDGSSVWVTGPNGVVEETTGTSLGGTVVAALNGRAIEVAPAAVSPTGSNQLYGSTNKGSLGVQSFSPALPTVSGATSSVLNGMTAATAPETYAFFFANSTTMFVADASDGIQEWTLSSGTWSNVATLAGSYVGLTGVQTGNTVSLYATTGTSAAAGRVVGNALVSDTFTFNSGTTGTGTFNPTPTVLATASANDSFAGVAFAPQASNIIPVVSTSSSTTAGSPQTVTVTAEYGSGPDVGQTDTGYTGTIAFTSSDSQAGLPASYTFTAGNNGVATFSATLKTAGSQTITATDTSSDTTSSATVAVSPAALNQLAISAPADATAGIGFSVTVTAQDQYGNTITGYTGTVSFSGGGGGATLPGSYTFVSGDDGSHTFGGVKLTAGSATGTGETITVTDSGNSLSNSASVDDFVVSNFTSGDLVVEQINAANNAVTPTSAASPVFLSEYSTTGTQSSATLTVPVWSAATSGSTNPLTLSGTAASEGELSLSANGQYLVLAGYDSPIGGTTQGTSTVGLVNGSGVVDTSTTTTLLNGNNTRGAASVDGTSVWVAGANGVVYETDGSSSGTLVDNTPNAHAIEVAPAAVSPTGANGLFASTDKTTHGVQGFSSALPTATGSTNTTLTGMYNATAPDSYAFFFANPTTMFVADATDGIQEWTLLPATSTSSGGVWSNIATLAGSYVGLTGVQTGNTVTLYATTGTSAAGGQVAGNSLISDTFTFNSGTTGTGTFGSPTTLATAGADDSFAGVSFAPASAAISAPTVSVTNPSPTFTLGGAAKTVDSGLQVSSSDTSITGATMTITNYQSGDSLNFSTVDSVSEGTPTVVGSTLVVPFTGTTTAANYQAALRTVTFSTTSTDTAQRTIDVVADDSAATPTTSNTGVETVNVAVPAPTVTPGTTGVYSIPGSPVAVDSTLGLSSLDANLTGASVVIGNPQTGDTLTYTLAGSITSSGYSAGTLTFSGTGTVAQYQSVLDSVKFSSTNATSAATTFRTVTFTADDSNALGNGSVGETLKVDPYIKQSTPTVKYTAGQSSAVTVDSAATVWAGANLTSLTVSISSGFAAGDTLTVGTPGGLTTSYNSGSGLLTLSGSATASTYQTALQSVQFSSTSSTTGARTFTMQAVDTADPTLTGNSPASDQVTVTAPITVSAAYIASSSWNSTFLTYLSGHTNAVTSKPYGSSAYGYAFQTGSTAIETQTLPWTTLNEITVTFSGPVSDVALGSLKLVGGSNGTTPSVTGFATDALANTYTWTLSGALTNNKYVFAIATTGSSFGTAGTSQVVDGNGAGISGHFTEGQNFPSGTGLANSTFDFFFDVFPDDANRDGTDNTTDVADVRALSGGTRSTASSYNPYYDLNGDATINTTDLALVRQGTGRLASNSPTAPASQYTSLALGSVETVSSTSSTTPAISNVIPVSTSPTVTTSTSVGTGSGSSGSGSSTTNSSGTHGRHSFAASERSAATDEAVSEFDLADLYV